MGDQTSIRKKLINFLQLKELGINYARESLWRLEKANKFPRRIYLSPGKIVWDLDEILAHIERLSAERSARKYRDHD